MRTARLRRRIGWRGCAGMGAEVRRLATIESEAVWLHDDGSFTFRAKAAIDGDGAGGNVWNEPIPPWQGDTSLHRNGQALNPNTECFIVLPPKIIGAVVPVVLGCKVRVWNLMNGIKQSAVVGDVGPQDKLGEISVELARRLEIPESPISGGVDDHIVFYRVWPGVPAVVDGITYPLQAS